MHIEALQPLDEGAAPTLLPLSSAQSDIWVAQSLEPWNPVYNIGRALEIGGAVDFDRFSAALRRAVSRTDAQRINVIDTRDGPRQYFASFPNFDIPFLDLSGSGDPRADALAWMRSDMQRPFDLRGGPLFRYALIKVAKERFFFWMVNHHLITDSVGSSVFESRVAALYRGEDDAATFGETLSWADFLNDEQAYRHSSRCERDRRYWLEQLSARPEVATLSGQPPEWARGVDESEGFVSRSTVTRLEEIGAACNASLAAVFAAITAIYASRISGSRDLVLGTAVAGRTSPDLRRVIGLASNVVPLRMNVDLAAPVAALLQQAGQRFRAGLRHQRYWAGALRRDLGLTPDQPNIYGTLLNFIPSEADFSFGGAEVRKHTFVNSRVEDLMITVHADNGDAGIRLQFSGHSDHYGAKTLRGHLLRFLHLIEAVAADSRRPIGLLALLGTDERDCLLTRWNSPAADMPTATLPALFEAQAASTPDAVALVFENRILTYDQLNRRANRLAHRLIRRGVGPESLVGLCVERSLEMVIGMLGILKAGGAYLPLDLNYPEARREWILENARPRLVLMSAEGLDAPEDTGRADEANPDDRGRRGVLTAAHPAYVIYTSGSTGTPKGVVVTHRGFAALAAAQGEQLGVTAQSRVLQFASLNFDASLWEVLMAFTRGAALVLTPPGAAGGAALRTLLVDQRITHATLPPAVLPTLVNGDDLPLEFLIVAGEACPAALIARWSGGLHMINAYGPTESTVCASMSAPLAGGPAPIGRPIAGTRLYVLDAALEPLPIGVAGELYIAGMGLARGYLHRPALTAERFVADPYGEPGSRMYRSGDLARWRPDGVLEYLGRTDSQVKIRGMRVELGEIEAALLAQPGIVQAAAVARDDGPAGRYVAAYLVGRVSHQQDPAVLRHALAERLPEHMVPAAFVTLGSLPLTPSGKLDLRALPAPGSAARVRAGRELPHAGVESEIAAIWSDLLELEHIGRHDNFFALGGNSLLVIGLIERLRRRAWHIEVRAVFSHPTVAGMAARIEFGHPPIEVPPCGIPLGCARITPDMLPLVALEQKAIDAIVADVPGGCANIVDIYPLAPLQQGILVHTLMSSGRDAYVLRALLELDSREHVDRFIVALQSVIDRHDVLRSAFHWIGLAAPLQSVRRKAALPVEHIALGAGDAAAALWATQPARIDVGKAPLMRILVTPDAPRKRWLLLLQCHHLTVDHTTLELMMAEVRWHLAGRIERLAPPIPFRNFVAEVCSSRHEEQEAFFRRMLGDVDETTAPFGLLEVRGDGSGIREGRLAVEAHLGRRLRTQARRLGVTVSSVFHLAWGLLVGRASAREDVVFGTVVFGRMHGGGGVEHAFGLFINTLPLRLALGETPVIEAVRNTHVLLAQLLRHEHTPLALAQRCSALPAATPLFSALLNYRYSGGTGGVVNAGDSLAPGVRLLQAEERTNYPLGLSVDDLGTDFTLVAQAAGEIDPADICQLMHTSLEHLARALDEAPDTPLRRLGLLSSTERHRLKPAAKLDRHALPGSGREHASAAPPQTPTEITLARIWQEILGADGIGRSDDFFELGGHSLLALQVLSRVRDVFRIELPLKLLFDARTLAAVAAAIDSSSSDEFGAPLPAIARGASTGPAPLSSSQERMWLIQSLDPSSTAYNMGGALRLRGPLHVPALVAAMDALHRRHEVLRTTIRLTDDRPLPYVELPGGPTLSVLDLRGLPDARSEALRLATLSTRIPYDLATGPMLRPQLLQLDNDEHLLVLVLHHIAGDQWSFGVLGRELSALYNALLRGKPEPLEPLPISYRDYARWQRQALETREFDQTLAFWRRQLADLPALELPTDHPRPRLLGSAGAHSLTPLPPDLRSSLERLARESGGTLFMTLFAAFAALMHRLSGQSDIPIGVPVANRNHSAIEGLIGTFVNTVILRSDASGNPEFGEFLQRTRSTALGAFEHQELSFDRLVQELAQGNDRSRAPLAQVLFNVTNTPMHGVDFDGLTWEPIRLDRGAAMFELGVTVDTEVLNGVSVEYNTELFEHATIERLIEQYFAILEAVAAAPTLRLGSLPMLPAQQRATLRQWNSTQTPYPEPAVFSRQFESQTEHCPDAAAISCGDENLSYQDLNGAANRLARALRERGVGPGVHVGVCLERSPVLLVALLATLKSGGAYVPLDPQYPPQRLKYMLSDSGAKLLITTAAIAANLELPEGFATLDPIALMSDDAVDAPNLETAAAPTDAAYVVYTSGSTGRPKGVVVSHGALLNLLWSMRQRPGLKATDVLAAVTTISFDIAALELYLPLLVGARIELVSRETAADGRALSRLLEASGATVLQATPATWRMLLAADWPGRPGLRALCGGEALARPLADALLDRVDELWNLYGPTETTVWSTADRVERGISPISIGRPIANTQIYLLDPAGEPVPIGVIGEICIGGAGVADYHQRPKLSAQRFIGDPYSAAPGARLYRTGDLGRWGPDGKLYHLGRQDQQVKIRGFRIELGEIETVLCGHTSVREALVVVGETQLDDQRLIAYVVYQEGEDLTTSDMRRYLRRELPEFMVPSIIVPLASMPLTPNGKVDRAALPDPFRSAQPAAAAHEPPASGMEQLIAEIWSSVLATGRISAEDNFFELGGYSLLALRVVEKVQKRTGYRLDPRALFFQKLRQIAALVENNVAAPAEAKSAP